MAWRAKAGDNFGEIFGYFSSNGKVMKKILTPLKGCHPAPRQSNGNRMAVLDDFFGYYPAPRDVNHQRVVRLKKWQMWIKKEDYVVQQ
jgi:hypothetical protein